MNSQSQDVSQAGKRRYILTGNAPPGGACHHHTQKPLLELPPDEDMGEKALGGQDLSEEIQRPGQLGCPENGEGSLQAAGADTSRIAKVAGLGPPLVKRY